MLEEKDARKAIIIAVHKLLEDRLDSVQETVLEFNVQSIYSLLDEDVRRHEQTITETLSKMVEHGIFRGLGGMGRYATTPKFLREYKKIHEEETPF